MSVRYASAGRPIPKPTRHVFIGGSRTYEIVTGLYGRVLALTTIVMFAPIWIVIAAAIKATSPGPVLFRMPIVGRDGRIFTYNKFRTMKSDGGDEEHRRWISSFVSGDHPYTTDATGAPVYKMINDSRVTRIGRLLRRLSLDEMPQLLNVLRGEMNIIGPRPPVIYEYSLYGPRERMRLAVKPGITGLYQVRKRGRASFSEMLTLDLEYVRRRSLWLDLCIMLRTPQALLRGEVAAR